MTAGLLLALGLCGVSEAGPAPRAVPTLRRAPVVDGRLGDLAPALEFQAAGEPGSSWTGKLAVFKDRVFLGLTSKDEQLLPGDLFEVSLYFPGVGATSRGHLFRVSREGLLSVEAALGPPEFAQKEVKAAAIQTAEGLSVELSIPVQALPRLPARGPLELEACITYEDLDAAGTPPSRVSSCEGGRVKGGTVRLPEGLRKQLALAPPPNVFGMEPRPTGWVGFDALRFPVWAHGHEPLTSESLSRLVTPEALEPSKAGIPVPARLQLPDGRPVYPVLTGKDPFLVEDVCDAEAELRLALYAVKGENAVRVLEWPAASCALGRAVSFELEADGALTIGYSGGSTASFTWSRDHFERTEYGRR